MSCSHSPPCTLGRKFVGPVNKYRELKLQSTRQSKKVARFPLFPYNVSQIISPSFLLGFAAYWNYFHPPPTFLFLFLYRCIWGFLEYASVPWQVNETVKRAPSSLSQQTCSSQAPETPTTFFQFFALFPYLKYSHNLYHRLHQSHSEHLRTSPVVMAPPGPCHSKSRDASGGQSNGWFRKPTLKRSKHLKAPLLHCVRWFLTKSCFV